MNQFQHLSAESVQRMPGYCGNTLANNFAALDAQTAEDSFAKLTPQEIIDWELWLDQRANESIQAQSIEDCLPD